MARYIVADWHLGEDRFDIMQRYGFKDKQDMVDVFIQLHNEIVSPKDTVYVVGDVCNKNAPEFLSQVEKFNGEKILFRGNHDRDISDKDFSKYFNKIYQEGDGLVIDVKIKEKKYSDWDLSCYINHYPSLGKSEYFNLVGHIHSAWKVQLNSLNVGVDCNHYRPYNIDKDIPFLFKAIRDFYDDDVWVAYNKNNLSFKNIRGKEGNYYQGEKHV